MTPVERIYDVFLSQITDEMFALLRPSVVRRELHKYLEGATVQFRECKNSLVITNYSFNELDLPLGEDTILLPKDREKGIEVIGLETGIEYKEGIDWNIKINEESREQLVFEIPPSEQVKIELYNNGSIEGDLTLEEIYILAQGMNFYWLHPKLNEEENLHQVLTDGDYKRLSGANMLDKMIKLYKTSQRELDLAVIKYTYNDMEMFN